MNKEQNEMEHVDETKKDIGYDARKSTVFYEEWYRIMKDFPLKERDKAFKYIFEYAFYGIEPEIPDRGKTPPMSYVVFRMARPNINSAQKRYDTAKENGQKGGRPRKVTEEVREKISELRKKGMTQKEVAIELGLSLKTIQRVEKDKSQNHNVNVNVNVNDNVDVNSVASDEDNTESASPPTESTIPSSTLTPQTELTEMDIYNRKILVIKYYRDRKKIQEIVQKTGFGYGFVNDVIDEYKNNGYKFPEKPTEIKKLDIPLLNGKCLNKTKEELFNDLIGNGEISVDEIDWKILEESYIQYGIAPFAVKQLIKEFQQKLQNINDATVLQRAANN